MVYRRGYDDSWPALDAHDPGEINHHRIAQIKQVPSNPVNPSRTLDMQVSYMHVASSLCEVEI